MQYMPWIVVVTKAIEFDINNKDGLSHLMPSVWVYTQTHFSDSSEESSNFIGCMNAEIFQQALVSDCHVGNSPT